MSNTYGSNSDFPGVTVQTSGGSVSDPTQQMVPGIKLWGHSIVLDEGDSIKCQACDKEEDVPDLLSMSSGFREVVYKMYILGKFRQDGCISEPEDVEDIRRKAVEDVKRNYQVDPNKIYWSKTTTSNGHNSGSDSMLDMYFSQGEEIIVDGTGYIYYGDGTWRDADRNIALGTVDLIEKYGNEAKKKLPPEVVHEKQKVLDNRKKMMAQNGSIDTVGARDLQDAGVDPATSQSVSINQDPDVDVDKSISEKFAEMVKEGRNQFIR